MSHKMKAPKKNKGEVCVCLVPAVNGASAFSLFLCKNRRMRTRVVVEAKQIFQSSSCLPGRCWFLSTNITL